MNENMRGIPLIFRFPFQHNSPTSILPNNLYYSHIQLKNLYRIEFVWMNIHIVLVEFSRMSSTLYLYSCAYAKGMLLGLFSSNVGIISMVGEPQPKFMARVHTQRFLIYNEKFKNCDTFGVTYKTFVSKFPKITERFNFGGK